MKAKLQNGGLKAALVAVLGSLVLAGSGFVAASAVASGQSSQASSDWTHLGGDPLFPGGLSAIAQQQGVSLRQAFVFAVTSSRGQTAMTFAGMNPMERNAVTTAARMGNFRSCSLRYGMTFLRMSFGIHGTSVDQNVTFKDPRYRNHPAAAFCMDVPVGSHGAIVHILVPVICVNIALISRTSPPIPVVPGQVKVLIRKQAFSAANEEQLIFPTPTNVFRFKVQCGLHGKPRFIVYQSDPQPAGSCPVNAVRVLIWELSTLGPDKWQFLSPAYQTFNLKGKKSVLAVFKDKQVKQVSPPTTTVVTTTATTTTSPPPTTTVQPKSNVDLCLNIAGEQTAVPAGFVRDSNGNCFPVTTTTTTTTQTTTTTTTTPTTTTQPKSDTDLCINIDGVQTAVPAGYSKDPPDPGVPGNCTYVGP